MNFWKLNKFHNNIKLTIEENPTKFLDTNIKRNDDGTSTCSVVNKKEKLPFHWSSMVPTQYKRNVILGDLHRAREIGTSFQHELTRIRMVTQVDLLKLKFGNLQHRRTKWLFLLGFLRKEKTSSSNYLIVQETKELFCKIIQNLEDFTNYQINFFTRGKLGN